MPRSASAHSKEKGPPRHTWLFGDRNLLAEEETEAAYYYEFALDSPQVIEEIEVLRKKVSVSENAATRKAVGEWHRANPRPKDFQQWDDWAKRALEHHPEAIVITKLRDSNVHFLADWPEFPLKHW